MIRRPHPFLRCLLALLLAAACWFLLVPALEMPVQELQGNILPSLRATAALTALAACYCLCYRPRLYVNRTDIYAALFLGWVTAGRSCGPGWLRRSGMTGCCRPPMIYVALRIVFTAERRTTTLLLMLLCLLGIYESWVGHTPDLWVRAVQPRTVQNNRHAFQPGPVCGVHRPRIRMRRGLCRQIPVRRTGIANVGLAAAPAFGRPAVGRGALPARLGRGAHDGRSPPGVDEQGRADRRRRGLRGARIPGVECPGSLPTRIPCASIARGGAFGAGRTAPCGRRRRGIPYQASFGRRDAC